MVSREVFKNAQEVVKGLEKTSVESQDWLIETTEKFCKEKAMYNAVRKAIEILDDPKDGEGPGSTSANLHRCSICCL
jgi:hypothetical protein